jgi:hypothetical protein
MTRLVNVYFPERMLLLVLSETALLALSLMAATFVIHGADTGLYLAYEQGYQKIAVTLAILMICMYYYDLYDSMVLSSPREVTTRLVQVMGTACLIQVAVYYGAHSFQLEQDVYLVGIVFVAISLALWRSLFFAMNRFPRLAQRALFFGKGPLVPASGLSRPGSPSRPEHERPPPSWGTRRAATRGRERPHRPNHCLHGGPKREASRRRAAGAENPRRID